VSPAQSTSAADTTRAVVDRLVGELVPVNPVRLGRVFALCVVVQLAVAALALVAYGIRGDLAQRLAEPTFLLIVLPLALAAPACATIAVRMAVPGHEVRLSTMAALLVLPLVIAGLVLVTAPWGTAGLAWSDLIGGCWHCIGITLASAVAPWLAMVVVVGRLAPLRAARVGIFAGLAAFFVGAFVTELHCAARDAYHIAISHYLPVALLSIVAALVSAPLLRRLLDPRRSR
jgi:hypothetical protein